MGGRAFEWGAVWTETGIEMGESPRRRRLQKLILCHTHVLRFAV